MPKNGFIMRFFGCAQLPVGVVGAESCCQLRQKTQMRVLREERSTRCVCFLHGLGSVDAQQIQSVAQGGLQSEDQAQALVGQLGILGVVHVHHVVVAVV